MNIGQSATTTSTAQDRFVYHAEAEQPPSEAVITAIAMQSDEDDLVTVMDDLEPLYNAIDPSALDSLFDSPRTQNRSGGTVTFEYAGHRVTVDATGRIALTPAEHRSH